MPCNVRSIQTCNILCTHGFCTGNEVTHFSCFIKYSENSVLIITCRHSCNKFYSNMVPLSGGCFQRLQLTTWFQKTTLFSLTHLEIKNKITYVRAHMSPVKELLRDLQCTCKPRAPQIRYIMQLM